MTQTSIDSHQTQRNHDPSSSLLDVDANRELQSPRHQQQHVLIAAANISTAIFVGFMIFQLLMAAGIVPVSVAWGGKFETMAPAMRISSSLAAALLLVFFAYVIRCRSVVRPCPVWVRIGSWLVTAYAALNTIGNFTGTNVEVFVFGPITFILTVCCFIVSSSKLQTDDAFP